MKQGVCEYPGCYEPATLECHTIGCTHKVCETHGNCVYEVTPDEVVPICWYCCGKGWGEVEEYNRRMDERNHIIASSIEKPWLPLHDGE